MQAKIRAISYHLPVKIETNEDLQRENGSWDVVRIAEKTGIHQRRIAASDETAGDLAYAAAEKLFACSCVQREEIDYILFCTQSADFVLPATACILQHRLRLSVTSGALDFNQGCSGYVYGLQMANGLICSGAAKNVLLLTGETYSKYIHPKDRTVRVLFGDAGTATVVSAGGEGAALGTFVVGTDGAGADNLIVPIGGARRPIARESREESCDESGSVRSANNLYMDGQELFAFTLKRIPSLLKNLLEKAELTREQVDMFIFHQANAFMNEHLRSRMQIPKEKAPLLMKDVGNTVSNTIPITLCRIAPSLRQGDQLVLVGFGVGYSWAGCTLKWNSVEVANAR